MASKKTRNASRVDPVEVYCRVRPLPEHYTDHETCLKILDDFNLMMQIPECSASYRSGQIKQLIYSFTQIFNDRIVQSELYEQVGIQLISDLLMGKNSLLFTYGVTGSGKTYTMIGNQYEFGLLQISLDTLFNSIGQKLARKNLFKSDKMNSFDVLTESELLNIEKHQRHVTINKKTANPSNQPHHFSVDTYNKDNAYAVFISCIEIYNNYIYDLLDDCSNDYPSSSSSDSIKNQNNGSNSMPKESKSLKEDQKGVMYIKDVNEIEVRSTEEALELINKAQKRRVIASTDLNSESSRSHSIFTIRLVQANACSPINNITISQLSLVDLAGSERTKRTKNTGSRLREAGSINSSLMALRNCMETLRENTLSGTRKMVPYRDSKLTLLFKNYFEGNGKIKMILCINPSSIEFDETINVLKFSDLIKDVLVPASNAAPTKPQNIPTHSTNSDGISWDFLEQSALNILNKLQQNNFSLMMEPFPAVDLFSPDDNSTVSKLVSYLEEYKTKREGIIHETDLIKQQYISKLKEIDDEFEKLREERHDFKYRLEQKERDLAKSESKIKALEKIINSNYSIQMLKTPNLVTPGNNFNSNKENFKQIQQIYTTPVINHNSTESSKQLVPHTPANPEQTPITSSSIYRSGRFNHQNYLATGGATTSTRNFGQPPLPLPLPTQTPSLSSRTNPITSTTTQTTNMTSSASTRFQSPSIMNRPPMVNSNANKDGVPVANRRQRRSRSADMWLDHKPASTTKMDSVMQPKMQKKKSVSRLELNDAKKSNKYVLTHQHQDEDGEIITNLIKGDILKSPSGGANVVFTDVETLKIKTQEVPKRSGKRQSAEEPTITDKLVIEDRCSMAIEGHSSSSSKSTNKTVKRTKL